MPINTGMTWYATPGIASELVLEVDIRCWSRELWWLLVKPGHLNSLVGPLLSFSSWYRSLPDIWGLSDGCPAWRWEAEDRYYRYPRLCLLILRSPGQTTQPRPLSQPRLSYLLIACHHLLSQSGPTCRALACHRASGEDIGSREKSRMSNSTCTRRCLVPNQKSYEGPNTQVNTNTKFFP